MQAALDEAIALSGSEQGYVHYLGVDEYEPHIAGGPANAAGDLMELFGAAGPSSWYAVKPRMTPLIVNNPSADGEAADAAVEPHRYMIVPIVSGETIVASVGVANKPADYTEQEGQQLAQLLETAWRIAERRASETAMRASEERYRKIFDLATEAMVIADYHTGIITDCNVEFLRLSGYTRDEILGRPQSILHPKDESDEYMSASFLRHRTDHNGRPLRTQLVTRAGRIKDIVIKANILDLGGRTMLQGIFRDLTEELRIFHTKSVMLSDEESADTRSS